MFHCLHVDICKVPVGYMDLREDSASVAQPAVSSPSNAAMLPGTAGVGTKARQIALNRFAPQKLVILL